MPVAHIRDQQAGYWEKLENSAKKGILDRLAKEGLVDFENHIKFEVVFKPEDWKTMFNLSRGSTFGSLDHNLMQMGYFRPRNKHREIKNLFFAGGSTHPGNGVPMTIISAQLTTEKILKLDR